MIFKKILGKEKDCLKNEDAVQGTTQGTSLTKEESATHQGEQPSMLETPVRKPKETVMLQCPFMLGTYNCSDCSSLVKNKGINQRKEDSI